MVRRDGAPQRGDEVGALWATEEQWTRTAPSTDYALLYFFKVLRGLDCVGRWAGRQNCYLQKEKERKKSPVKWRREALGTGLFLTPNTP